MVVNRKQKLVAKCIKSTQGLSGRRVGSRSEFAVRASETFIVAAVGRLVLLV